jgi:hypothetical protein
MPTEYVSLGVFELIVAIASPFIAGALGAMWFWLGRQEDRQDNFMLEMQKAELRAERNLATALHQFAEADAANDDLRLRVVNETIAGVKTDVSDLKLELHATEMRLLTNLNDRRNDITRTMQMGFDRVAKAMGEDNGK